MAVAGFCRSCGQYVWLNDQWGCVNGHPWTEISNWYDPAQGVPVPPYWLQQNAATPAAPSPAPGLAPMPAAPVGVPAAPAPAPAATPEPVPARQPEPTPAAEPAPAPRPAAPAASDRLTLLADILATLGQYPAYSAQYGTDTDVVVASVAPAPDQYAGQKRVDFSAIMKAVEAELALYYWDMLTESGDVSAEYPWDYTSTRRIVDDVAGHHGWTVKTVLQKESAQW